MHAAFICTITMSIVGSHYILNTVCRTLLLNSVQLVHNLECERDKRNFSAKTDLKYISQFCVPSLEYIA